MVERVPPKPRRNPSRQGQNHGPREGGKTIPPTAGSRGKPKDPFPKLPVRQKLVRDLVKNSSFQTSRRLRKTASKLLLDVEPGHSRNISIPLPRVILVKTQRNVGSPIAEGYKVLYSKGLLGRPSWVRELFYSQNSLPQSCLRQLLRFLKSINITETGFVPGCVEQGVKSSCLRALCPVSRHRTSSV